MDDKNPDPTIEQLDEPAPAPAPSPADDDAKADAQVVNDGSGRFAVYDKDELRFRGRVHETRKGADDLKSELGKGKRRGRYEVREV